MTVALRPRPLAPGDEPAVSAALRDWEAVYGCGWQLQAGDLGWALRFEPDLRADQIQVWRNDAGEPVAVVVIDQPGAARCAVAPGYLHDHALARAMVADLTGRLDRAEGGPWIDPPPGPCALSRALIEAGYEPEPDLWLHLWRPLPGPPVEPSTTGGEIRPCQDTDLEERVALQRAAFDGSSMTPDRYARLRTVPGYAAELDLVHEAKDGTLSAFCLAWPGPPAGTGLLEPVGSHPRYRGQGHAKATVAAALDRLAALGASGVAVVTPLRNTAAVRLYRSLGMSVVGERRAYWPKPV